MDWIERQKRIFLHVTPTRPSWLNLVERFFSLTQTYIRRGVCHSMDHLERCLKDYNETPRPLVWTKSASEILKKAERARQVRATAST